MSDHAREPEGPSDEVLASLERLACAGASLGDYLPLERESLASLERLARAGAPHPTLSQPPAEDEPEEALLQPAEPATKVARPPRPWSEQTHRELLQSLPDAVVVVDGDGAIVLVNAEAERMFGYRREELLGQTIEALVPERSRHAHVGHRAHYFANPRLRPMGAWRELFGRRKDGSEFPVEISLSPLHTEQGLLATSVIRDISQRKREEAKFRTLVENIPAVTFIAPLDESAPELYVSPQIQEMLGFTQQEWLEDPILWYRQLHPDDRDRWNDHFAPTCASGKRFDSAYRFVAKDGRKVWVHGSARMVRDTDGRLLFVQGMAFDITSIKEAEEERERFFSLSVDLFCVVGLDGSFKRVNKAFTRTLGHSAAELLSVPYLDFVHPDDRRATEIEMQKLTQGVALTDFENRCRCKDGSYRWLQWGAVPDLDRHVIFAAARDVTEHKRDEETLREQAHMALLRADVSAAITRSDTLQEMLQRCVGALTQHLEVAWARIWTFNEKANALELRASAGLGGRGDGAEEGALVADGRQALCTNAVVGDERIHDQEWARREGLVAFAGYPLLIEQRLVGVVALFSRQPFSQAVGESLELVAGKISLGIERKRAEEELRRINAALEERVRERTRELQDKAEELETYAYQVSHDLAKPLLALVNYPEKVLKHYGGQLDGKADEWINKTIQGAKRMGLLIENLLHYSRVVQRERVLRATSCAASAREACVNLQFQFDNEGSEAEGSEATAPGGEKVTLGELPTVLGNYHQLMLLFQNLIGNAVKFRAAERPPQVEVGARQEQDHWLFWVRDNGIGIETKFLRRIFGLGERHAREASKYAGTGYGLHICEKIVTGHGGRIWAESEVDQGSTFYFTLPIPRAEA